MNSMFSQEFNIFTRNLLKNYYESFYSTSQSPYYARIGNLLLSSSIVHILCLHRVQVSNIDVSYMQVSVWNKGYNWSSYGLGLNVLNFLCSVKILCNVMFIYKISSIFKEIIFLILKEQNEQLGWVENVNSCYYWFTGDNFRRFGDWIKPNVDSEKAAGLGWIETCIAELLKLWNIETCYMFSFINWLFDEVKPKRSNLWINNF